MDAITLLKNDHRTVEKLFKRFEKAGDGALVERRRIVEEIVRELSVHAEIEETVFYPAIRQSVPKAEDMVLESLEEHHVAKWVLSEIDGMDPGAERFEAKVTVLMENIRHHVEEEESELFPQVRKALGRKALNEMGDAMARAKTVAPTHPHPRSPDTPPGNIVSGVVAAALDRARDAGQDLVESATGAARRSTRRTSGGAGARKATTRKAPAKRTAAKRTAKGTAKRAAKKATGTTKRTATKATGTARKAASTASRSTRSTTRKAAGTTKRTATRTPRATAKSTAKKATGTAKRTAKKATGTAKRTATKTTTRPRKAAKKRS